MAAGRGGEEPKVNLLDTNYCDKPNGSIASPKQYLFAMLPLAATLSASESVHFKMIFATNYEQKTNLLLYNSGSAGAASLATLPIVNGVAEGDFTWKVYGNNNTIYCYAQPNNNALPVPTLSHSELFRN